VALTYAGFTIIRTPAFAPVTPVTTAAVLMILMYQRTTTLMMCLGTMKMAMQRRTPPKKHAHNCFLVWRKKPKSVRFKRKPRNALRASRHYDYLNPRPTQQCAFVGATRCSQARSGPRTIEAYRWSALDHWTPSLRLRRTRGRPPQFEPHSIYGHAHDQPTIAQRVGWSSY
jgi:hypothetical protein